MLCYIILHYIRIFLYYIYEIVLHCVLIYIYIFASMIRLGYTPNLWELKQGKWWLSLGFRGTLCWGKPIGPLALDGKVHVGMLFHRDNPTKHSRVLNISPHASYCTYLWNTNLRWPEGNICFFFLRGIVWGHEPSHQSKSCWISMGLYSSGQVEVTHKKSHPPNIELPPIRTKTEVAPIHFILGFIFGGIWCKGDWITYHLVI